MNCKNKKIRTKKGIKYGYYTLLKKEVNINDVAWIDGAEGQYAKVQNIQTTIDSSRANIYNNENRNAVSDNLKSYTPNEVVSIMRKSNNVIVNNKQELADYVIEALNVPNSNKNLHLGIIPNETIQRIKNEIQNIKLAKIDTLFKDNINYALAVNQEEIRHMKKDKLSQQDIVDFIDSVDFENKKRTLSPTFDELNNPPNKTSKMDGLSVLSNRNNTTKQQKKSSGTITII